MTTAKEAIDNLDSMQRQIIHGKRTFGDIADVIRDLQKRVLLAETAVTACHSAMLGKVNPKHPAWGCVYAVQDASVPNAPHELPPTKTLRGQEQRAEPRKTSAKTAVLIEREERFCEIAAQRMSQRVLGLPNADLSDRDGRGGRA